MLRIGDRAEIEVRVEKAMTASHFGNEGMEVLATPYLISLSEQAAIRCLAPYLEAGQGSVGTSVQLRHLAPTPVGMAVRVVASVTEMDGRRFAFAIEAYDEKEKIAEGVHERFVVDRARFLQRAAAKRTA